ncbi:hypothetical protein FF80_02511 [Devosia sp. LC5]|uniref:hypothetical protein n=1 Tax=Devosia sp. LC5 TaxID=1502724 RepID=UPI0004E31D9F|nr:hypothetical protein [Devosia sp. LC5]KFC66250.1 hypothetical protein FF80_02511 [Devosia sp. LC5]
MAINRCRDTEIIFMAVSDNALPSQRWEISVRFNKFGAGEVDYAVHYSQFAAPFVIEGNETNNRFFETEAQEMHVFGVTNAVNELTADALLLLSMPTLQPEAEKLLRYGVMRRWRMIAAAWADFGSVVSPRRERPLSLEQSTLVGRSLNALYIDLHGLLDNYAWTLVHQFGSTETRNAKPMGIGLFSRTFRSDPGLAAIADQVASFETWETDFKTRRNPVAHRIPLHVPPAALTQADVAEHHRLDRLASEALRSGDFEANARHREATCDLGSFLPKFVHDPDEPLMNIFPTIPDDVGQVVLIGREVQEFICPTGAAGQPE